MFVSIVSTKIPFKGTGKEFIGSDIVEIAKVVKRSLQACCQQLRVEVRRRDAAKERANRKAMMYKVRIKPTSNKQAAGPVEVQQLHS